MDFLRQLFGWRLYVVMVNDDGMGFLWARSEAAAVVKYRKFARNLFPASARFSAEEVAEVSVPFAAA